MAPQTASAQVQLPRVAITYCTQCRWMLRAAYFGQELLSTFGTSIGEIALVPATGGLFEVRLTYKDPIASNNAAKQEVLIWDRKAEGGFPETKILKQRVRNHIEPGKDLGHSDKPSNRTKGGEEGSGKGTIGAGEVQVNTTSDVSTTSDPPKDCEDCK